MGGDKRCQALPHRYAHLIESPPTQRNQRGLAGWRDLAPAQLDNGSPLVGGATPRCRYAASVAMRPRGVRCK